MVSPSLKKILNYPNRVVCVLTFDDRETEKTRFFFWFLGSKFHSNMASRAASYLRISVFHRGFASGIYQTLLWWVVLYLPFICIYQWERLRYGFRSLIYVSVGWNGWSMILLSEYWFLEMGLVWFCHWYHIYFPSFGFYYSWDQWVLNFWKWGFLFLSLVSYIPSLKKKKKFIIKLLLRPMGSWMLAFIYQCIICVCV